MKRYDISLDVTPRGTSWAAEAQPEGHFVTYEDAQAAIQQAVLAERADCAAIVRGAALPKWTESCDVRDSIAGLIEARSTP